MYEVFLFVHSWFRWIVLIAGIRLLYLIATGWIQKRPWDSSDSKALTQFNEAFLYQVGMGIALYVFLSPLSKIEWQDFHFTFKDPILRFWTIEHATGMLSALSIFQIGKVFVLKKVKIEKRFKALTLTLILSLLIILATIPWPFLKHGRDLFRLYF